MAIVAPISSSSHPGRSSMFRLTPPPLQLFVRSQHEGTSVLAAPSCHCKYPSYPRRRIFPWRNLGTRGNLRTFCDSFLRPPVHSANSENMGRIKKRGMVSDGYCAQCKQLTLLNRNFWQRQKLPHAISSSPEAAGLPRRLQTAMYLQRHLPSRATIEEARIEIIDPEHHLLLHERHPIPPPRAAACQIQRSEDAGQEGSEGAGKE